MRYLREISFPILLRSFTPFFLNSLFPLFTHAQLPDVEWGTYYDIEQNIPANYFQADEELIDQIAIDGNGTDDFIYVTGRTISINKDISEKSWENAACSGDTITMGQKAPAAFLAKYTKDGVLLW